MNSPLIHQGNVATKRVTAVEDFDGLEALKAQAKSLNEGANELRQRLTKAGWNPMAVKHLQQLKRKDAVFVAWYFMTMQQLGEELKINSQPELPLLMAAHTDIEEPAYVQRGVAA